MSAHERLSDMRNLGPVMERWLSEVDVRTPEELRKLGALQAWRPIKFAFARDVMIVALLALEGALLDGGWRSLPAERTEELRRAPAAGASAPIIRP